MGQLAEANGYHARVRTVHVISGLDPRGGGPMTALLGLTRALVQLDASVTVVATYGRGTDLSMTHRLHEAGVAVRSVGPARGKLGRHPALKPTLQHVLNDADVVHIHGLWEQIQHEAARLAQARRIPYIIRPCGMLDPWSLRQSRWRKQLYLNLRLRRHLNQAAALHFTSNNEAQAREHLSLTPRVIVEPNGVSLEEFRSLPTRGAFRAMQPMVGDAPLIVFLGRVHPGKGLEYLIPAMCKVIPASAKLAIIGPDSKGYLETVRSRADALGLTNRVIFTGLLSGRQRTEGLVDADLFCLPSDHENFGIAVIEALAAGTPVIVSDQVNICEQIVEAGVGEATPPNVDSVAATLSRWLTNDQMRADAAQRARPFVWAHYDWQRIAQRWMAHYDMLTGSPTAEASAS